MGQYLRVSFDESILQNVFQKFENQLARQEEMILELKRLIEEKPSKTEIQQLHNSFSKQIEEKIAIMSSKIDRIEERMNNRFKQFEDDYENRIIDSANMIELSINQKISDIENRIPNGETHFGEFISRLQSVEDNAISQSKKIQLTRESVQQIASSIATLTTSHAVLDNTLPDTMRQSIGSINNNFQTINDTLMSLKDQMNKIRLSEKRQIVPEPYLLEHKGQTQSIDLSSIRTYPPTTAHWRDSPDLPPLHSFINEAELVDYIYQLVPKLQAHLTSMHGKIVENAQDILGKVDKILVEKMFEKFQSILGEMATRFDTLKNEVEHTATRDEINGMVSEILSTMNQQNQTSIGRVKCIACGRDTTNVTGALTEEEAFKIFGSPPTSFACKSGKSYGVIYSKPDGLDTNIIESPRSLRPKSSSMKGKLLSPR